jgi:hypothetical protein
MGGKQCCAADGETSSAPHVSDKVCVYHALTHGNKLDAKWPRYQQGSNDSAALLLMQTHYRHSKASTCAGAFSTPSRLQS